jgi:hypothetical protein
VHDHDPLVAGVGGFAAGTALALLAATLFAAGAVVQHEAVAVSCTRHGLDLRILLRQRRWMVGQTATALGSVVHVIALAHAPVAIVQPVLAAELVIALGFRAVRARRRLALSEVGGAVCTVGGLVVFLVAARPAHGRPEHLPSLWPVLVGVSVSAGLVALSARGGRGSGAAVMCGTSAGVAAGVAAMLSSGVFKEVSVVGWSHAVSVAVWWMTVVAAVLVGVVAQLGGQQAYARGALAWSLPALTVFDPLSAVPAARLVLGERLEPGHAVVWAPAVLVAVVGVVVLARTTPDDRRASARPQGRSANSLRDTL